MVTCGNMCSFWLISSKWAGNMLVTCQFTYSRHVTTTFDLKIVKINALLTHITVWYQPCNYYKTYVVTCGYFDNCLVKVVVTCLKYVNWYVNNMLPDYLLEISQRTLRYERTDGCTDVIFIEHNSLRGVQYMVTCGYFDNCLVKVVVTCLKYVNWHVTNMLPTCYQTIYLKLVKMSTCYHMLPHVTNFF